MDKFTVDLDQVLNDFEYSELTDQCNSSAKVADISSSITPSQNVTKHSITNVFHSLNEYLNTNVNSLEIVDNNINNDFIGDFSNSNKEKSIKEECKTDLNASSQIDEIEELLSDKSDFAFGEVTALKEDFNKFEDHLNAEVTHLDSVNGNGNVSNVEREDLLLLSKNEIIVDALELPFDNEDLLTDKSSENHVNLQTELQNVVGNDFGIRYEQNIIKPSTDITEFKTVIGFEQDLHLDDQEISRLLSELEEDDELNIDGTDESHMFSIVDNSGCESLRVDNDQNLSHKDLDTVNNEVSESINENKQSVGENYEELNLNKLSIENYSITDKVIHEFGHTDSLKLFGEKKYTQIPDEPNERLTWHEEITDIGQDILCQKDCTGIKQDISSESDLTSEFGFMPPGELSVEHQTTDVHIITLSTTPQLETVIKNNEKDLSLSNEVCEEIVKTNNELSFNCEEKPPSDSDYKEILIENEMDDLSLHSNADISNKEQTETFLEAEAANSCDIHGNDDQECSVLENEPSSTEIEQVIDENFSNNIQKEESTESVSRPDNLPLGTESVETNRKIDLIGDPGSTPYNNLYVNNEIGKQEQNTDLHSSSSSTSPTFSDTSSTASTASTEDIQYKQDLNDSTEVNDSTEPMVNLDETTENSMAVNSVSVQDSNKTSEESLDHSVEVPQEVTDTETERDPDATVEEQPTISTDRCWLGKEAPLWIPDSEATSCLHCDMRFTMLKRRHHCRACGLVLCSKCCHLRFRLEYLEAEARVCNRCHDILNKESSSSSSSDISPEGGSSPSHRPNPNNPSEYCSTISPLQQVSSSHHSPPAVMVPVGVLKRKGSNKAKSSKSVMFCDGIRPGSDLTNLDNDFNYNNTITKKLEKNNASAGKINRNLPLIDSETNTFIPKNENSLPPTITMNKSDIKYTECSNNINTVNILKTTQLTFAIHLSFHVHVKIINMDCCVNKVAWCFSTEGLINVGQDEIIILLEYMEDESTVPKDIFYHLTTIYNDAVKGNSIKELGLSLQNSTNFLDSKNHAGFIYVRPTFQCLENVIKPKDPFLIGILIHRWETPWAKLFPLRLVLRLGAEYRYYPSPIISTRHRDSVYVEIGHTIINILADFRNFSYSLPQIRGLTIHMEEKITTVSIPVNRYDQVIKSLNNSSDHILAFSGNFSVQADSHLVCIQDTQGNENCYSTHAINIHNKPRKITGASFIVFNGALKTSSGLTAKSNIIEDGLMIQVLPEHLKQIRDNLRAMKNHTISCGCVDNVSDETVQIVWTENDTNFNVGVISTIDHMPLTGIPSIRVHNGKNYICHNGSRIIRWTEVFIIQNGEDSSKNQDPVDISRVSESIAKATCDALVKYLDLLIAKSFQKIGIRVTLHVDNVSYCAGSNGTKLPPIYMKSLDNELVPVLHRITSNNFGENAVILELIFRILNV